MALTLRLKLSIMMFLQFAIWGVWYVTMTTYLGRTLEFPGTYVGYAYGTTAVAAIVSPFFVGMVADRFFPTQKILGVLHLAGGLLLYVVSLMTTPAGFLGILLLYALCYMPTLALANALCFHHMSAPERQFPGVRVLGTIGWIVVGVLVGWLALEATALPLQLGAALSMVMGVYCFFLPHTPPRGKGKKVTARDVLGLDALALMKERSFLIFIISSLLICIPLQFYYAFANRFLYDLEVWRPATLMTFGQVSEILFMLVLPFFLIKLGIKRVLLIGMLAWVVRYALFSIGAPDAVFLALFVGILLHGVCYDFFFVAGQIYVNKKANPEIRAAAQGFIAFITLGVGSLFGTVFSGWVVDHYSIEGMPEWTMIWLIPAAMAFVVLIGFALLFRDTTPPPAAELPPEPGPAHTPKPAG